MKTKYIYLLVAILCNCWVLKSQELPQMIPPSPKASSILKYGEYPVSLYTGLVDITVPIYTIDVKGIKVPIEFKYHASGIKYDDISLEVGLGWSLIAGGVIERTVRGMMDGTGNSFMKNEENIDPSGTGSYAGDISGLIDVANGGRISPKSGLGTRDGEFDMYSYSFLQHSGQFCISYNNLGSSGYQDVLFIPANPLKLKKISNEILLTDEKGNCHIFEQLESDEHNRHQTYYLTKIISTDKADTITFNYTYYPRGNSANGILRPQITKTKTILEPIDVHNPNISYYKQYEFKESGGFDHKACFPPRLNSISFKGGKVVFDYYNNLPASRDLRTIKIYNNLVSSPLQTISLIKGQFAGNRGERLDRVEFRNSQNDFYDYKFEYNGDPGINTNAGIDYWGYYNGASVQHSNYLPNFIIQVYSIPLGTIDHPLSYLNRSANEIAMKQGILNKIIYPTKGYTEFSYEAHKAWNNQIYGGLRIREISNYNEDGSLAEKKWYRYGENESGQGRGAAYPQVEDFMMYTRVLEHENASIGSPPELIRIVHQRDYICFPKQSYFASGSSVVYNKVTEYTGDNIKDNGKTVYQFEDFQDLRYPAVTPLLGTIPPERADMPVRTYSWKNGKLKSKVAYKKENGVYSIIYNLSNTYTDINTAEYENLRVISYIELKDFDSNRNPSLIDGKNSILYCADDPNYYRYREQFNNGIPFYYFNYYNTTGLHVLSSSTETIDGVSKQIYYDEYNGHGFPKSVRTVLSSGDNRTQEYKYPSDFSTLSPYNEMVEKNIISPVIEAAEYKNQNTFLKKTVNNYSKPYANIYLPSSLQTQQGTHAIETRVNYTYNSKGDLIEASKDNADKVVYLWSYNRKYPVAKIENATYAQVVQAFSGGQTAINALETATNPDMTPVNNLRNTLTDALVTTYTYKPLIGMLSETNPRGVKTSYEYDDFGRLKTVKDHNNAVVESYNYNYRNQ